MQTRLNAIVWSIFSFCIVVLITNNAPCQDDDDQAELELSVRQLTRSDQTGAAIALLNKSIEKRPDDTQLRLLRASVYDTQRDHKQAIADYNFVIEKAPGTAAFHSRARARFKSGDAKGSIKDFNEAIQRSPTIEPRLWDLGISYYYDGQFEKGARQFELYQTYDSADVENVVWRYVCQARYDGAEKARADMMPLSARDRRIPMMAIDALYRGKGSVEDVFAAARANDPGETELLHRMFYAHLYVALHFEANDQPKKAREHMLEADKRQISHYMWDVAHLHANRLRNTETDTKKPSINMTWPQVLGPRRNGVALGEKLRREWSGQNPAVVWEYSVGEGYAGVAVSGDRVIVFHRVDNREVVESLHARTGEQQWSHRWSVASRPGIDPDKGPRCVPVIHDDVVIAHGIAGDLVCVDLQSGKQRWARDTRKEFGFREGYFGAGSSPLVVDNKVLLNVGGEDGAGIVAFSLASGETIWKATQEAASYSSPILTKVGDKQLALFVTRLNFVGIDPDTGIVAFSVPFGRRGPTVNGANPLVVGDDHVLLTASYGIGAKLVKMESAKGSEVWQRRDVLSSQYPTPVHHHGAVYGIDGREDGPPADLRCIDPQTGNAHWTEARFGMATLILADDLLLAMKSDGQLVIIEPSQQQYREQARFRLFDSTTRALPALAEGELYVRDKSTLKCFDLSPPAP